MEDIMTIFESRFGVSVEEAIIFVRFLAQDENSEFEPNLLVDSSVLSDNFMQMITSAQIYDVMDEKQGKNEFLRAFGQQSTKFMSALNQANIDRINLSELQHIIGQLEPMNYDII